MKKQLQLAILLMATGLAAVAQTGNTKLYRSSGNEWIQEVSGTLPSAKAVHVKSSAGSIKVQGGQQNNIKYVIREHVRASSEEAARREISRMKFTTLSSGETVLLKADCEGYNRGSIDFDVQLPRQTAVLKLETNGGQVSAENLAGKLEANTGGGNIHLDKITGAIAVASGGGQIDIGDVGSDVAVSTGGGNIHIGSAAGRVVASSGGGDLRVGSGKLMTLETGGGSIKVNKCEGQIKAETGGGTIDLSEIGGPAVIESGGGGIKVAGIRNGLRAETGSGPIVATLTRGTNFSDSRLETSVGDIIVYVPDGLGVTIRAAVEVARGDGIRSDFPELKITHSGSIGPREVFAEGSLNGGGPVLHVHTATGNIQFLRTKSQ
ncbi:MAG TPA: hypothetical protein VJV96_02985 [Candidatus Angelobacter sp.]|jgi:DUF4097 and DUF4098 domain-containing protein YvlB|nr:hypothetical protein [Candidatus Angelobacter sp.]